MSLNTKKSKVIKITSNKNDTVLVIKVKGVQLEQVKEYKYLGSLIEEDMRCIKDIKTRIGMAKTAFWNYKELLRRDVKLQLRQRMLDCFVKSVISYGCETWTFTKEIQGRINAFQLWCYRRMLKIKYSDHVTNQKVKEIMKTENNWAEDLVKKKLKFAGHVMRGSNGKLTQMVLEGFIEGKKGRGRPKRKWGEDVKEWTASEPLGGAKRRSENKELWRTLVHSLRLTKT